MTRFLLFGLLLACLFYTFQANPLPQDATQMPPGSDFDRIAERTKEIWNNAKGAIEERVQKFMNDPSVSDALERAKSLLNQGGESIRKEAEKIGDKFND